MDGAAAPDANSRSEDALYLRAVTSCGDHQRLLVSQPIYSANGIKLLDAGARIDSRVFARLFGHTLAEPIDRCLTSENAVRHRDLVQRARELADAAPLLAHFHSTLPTSHAERLWGALAACSLPPAIAMRLTVVRQTVPALYDHLLAATFAALFIGVSARLGDRDLQVLATAALLHDIGMMHMDPALFAAERPLDLAGRRSLYAHPMAAQLIAQREPQLSPAVATAIAQHHERLDGSGYPRGLAGEAIGKHGRVLMLVEVVLALLDQRHELPDLQLSLILRLNHRSFDPQFSTLLLAALPSLALEDGGLPCNRSEAALAIAQLDAWESLCRATPPPADDAAAAFIDDRVGQLRRWLAEAGLSSGLETDGDAAAFEAPLVCAELGGLAREALWHLRQIVYDTLHRWPELLPQDGGAPAGAAAAWIATGLSVKSVTKASRAAAGTSALPNPG